MAPEDQNVSQNLLGPLPRVSKVARQATTSEQYQASGLMFKPSRKDAKRGKAQGSLLRVGSTPRADKMHQTPIQSSQPQEDVDTVAQVVEKIRL